MARTLLMVSPDHFGFNTETAVSNAFQKNLEAIDSRERALQEFETAVTTIRKKGIEVHVFPSPKNAVCPDAVFPNNWFSTHADGRLIIYPMLTPNRRAERNPEIIAFLENHYEVTDRIDLEAYELQHVILEGTGSLVFDHENKLVFACISPRTNEDLVNGLCSRIGYQPVIFEAIGPTGELLYHTNVMMAIGKKFVVICLECIEDLIERNIIREKILATGKELIEISFNQLLAFAGNLLEVENKSGESFIFLSKTAYDSLRHIQINALRNYGQLVPLPIPTIETIGGGSVRCMLAEIWLKKKKS